jgi:hypothetical protein
VAVFAIRPIVSMGTGNHRESLSGFAALAYNRGIRSRLGESLVVIRPVFRRQSVRGVFSSVSFLPTLFIVQTKKRLSIPLHKDFSSVQYRSWKPQGADPQNQTMNAETFAFRFGSPRTS